MSQSCAFIPGRADQGKLNLTTQAVTILQNKGIFKPDSESNNHWSIFVEMSAASVRIESAINLGRLQIIESN